MSLFPVAPRLLSSPNATEAAMLHNDEQVACIQDSFDKELKARVESEKMMREDMRVLQDAIASLQNTVAEVSLEVRS